MTNDFADEDRDRAAREAAAELDELSDEYRFAFRAEQDAGRELRVELINENPYASTSYGTVVDVGLLGAFVKWDSGTLGHVTFKALKLRPPGTV